jgi:L-rhamnonate dehydratase
MTFSRRWFCAMASGAVAAAAERDLRITSVKAAEARLRPAGPTPPKFSSDFDPARWRAFGPFSQLTGAILVQIRTAGGITGHGLGGGGGAAVYLIEHHLKDLLNGANAANVEMLWDQIYASTSFYGRRGLPVMALSGIDLALWDILGKHAGQPVWRLLGGAVKPDVPAYHTLGDLEQGLKLGFRAFKFPVRYGPLEGVEGMRKTVAMLEEARKTAGPEAPLMIDCLARWDVPYTLEMAGRLAPLKLDFIEEPLYPDDLSGYQQLCREIRGARIASGEHEFTHHGFRELIRNRASHILQPDLTWCGGLTTARKIVAQAEEAGLPVIPHRGGSLFGIHLILASRNCSLAESFGIPGSGNELMELLTAPFQQGRYLPPEKPGLGFELTPGILKKYTPALM